VRAVFDDIMATRKDRLHQQHLARTCGASAPAETLLGQMKEVMVKPSRLDPLTKDCSIWR